MQQNSKQAAFELGQIVATPGALAELADQTNKTDRKPGNLNPFAVSTMKGADPPSAWDQLKDH